MKYDIILLDADETLMDFPDAEHQALVRTFEDHHLTLTVHRPALPANQQRTVETV